MLCVLYHNQKKKRIWWQQVAVLGRALAQNSGNLGFRPRLPFPGGLRQVTCHCWALVSFSQRMRGVFKASQLRKLSMHRAWHISSLTFTQVWHLQKNYTHRHILSNQTHHLMPLNEWTAICLSISLVMEIGVDSSLGWVWTVLLWPFWHFHGAHRTCICCVSEEQNCWASGWVVAWLKPCNAKQFPRWLNQFLLSPADTLLLLVS